MRTSLALALAASVLLSLSGCGKAGRPFVPPDAVTRVYPNRDLTPTSAEQKDGRALPPEWDQQDLQARFTPSGSYIDPSAKVVVGAPAANSPNGRQTSGLDTFSKGLETPSPSPLQPAQPSLPSESPPPDEEPQR
jgi:predicted small lipoprotein YifL